MKKRIFTLLLTALLLTSLASCSKQEPEYGTFYKEEGILQNTLVTLVLETDELTYPVKEISYVLHDLSDYGVQRLIYFSPSMCCDQLEKYSNGKWVEARTQGNYGPGTQYPVYNQPSAEEGELPDADARTSYEITMEFYGKNMPYYMPLEPGLYRVRVKYRLYTDDENAYIPEGRLEAVAYFTVTAPTE